MSFLATLGGMLMPTILDTGQKLFKSGIEYVTNYANDRWFKKSEPRSSLPNMYQLRQSAAELPQSSYGQQPYYPSMFSQMMSDESVGFGKQPGQMTLGATFARSDWNIGNMGRTPISNKNYGSYSFTPRPYQQRDFAPMSASYGDGIYSQKPYFMNGSPQFQQTPNYRTNAVPSYQRSYNDFASYGQLNKGFSNNNQLVKRKLDFGNDSFQTPVRKQARLSQPLSFEQGFDSEPPVNDFSLGLDE